MGVVCNAQCLCCSGDVDETTETTAKNPNRSISLKVTVVLQLSLKVKQKLVDRKYTQKSQEPFRHMALYQTRLQMQAITRELRGPTDLTRTTTTT